MVYGIPDWCVPTLIIGLIVVALGVVLVPVAFINRKLAVFLAICFVLLALILAFFIFVIWRDFPWLWF